MTVGGEAIEIALAVDQWRDRLGMYEGYVVHLHVGLHRHLPVALELERMARGEAQAVEAELVPFVP